MFILIILLIIYVQLLFNNIELCNINNIKAYCAVRFIAPEAIKRKAPIKYYKYKEIWMNYLLDYEITNYIIRQ